jgi:hypothetical protein
MNPRFLWDEAVRFQGMAADADREATRLRLLAMAVDYDARAMAADGLTEPQPDDVIKVKTGPNVDETTIPKVGRKFAVGSKATVTVERRAVGRPRLGSAATYPAITKE